jgi:hypothetical protein
MSDNAVEATILATAAVFLLTVLMIGSGDCLATSAREATVRACLETCVGEPGCIEACMAPLGEKR